MLARCDAVVVLVGGIGTLDEATEVLEMRKHRQHDKPVVLLNTAGFYDGLARQLRRMEEDGLLPVLLDELVYIADNGPDALAHLERMVEAKRA
jgi:predicted Rossmann-fold nucleotide-binding protein